MALPTTITTAAGKAGHYPPFKSSAGNFYVITSGNRARKATDPTDSWAEQDFAGKPSNTLTTYSAVQDGDIIHIAGFVAGGDDVYHYHTFNMATDQWVVVSEVITDNDLPDTLPTFTWISIAVRSDGDVVVVYAGDTDAEMGNEKERVDVNIRTSGTWSGPTSLDAGGDIHYGNPNCVLGTNDFVHCLFQRQSSTADDPPTSWNTGRARSVDPADDSLSTVITGTGHTSNFLLGIPRAISYDNSGTQQIVTIGWFGNEDDLKTFEGGEDVNDEIEYLSDPTVSTPFGTEQGFVNGEVNILTYAELDTVIHLLYSGGGTNGVDQDLYYTTSADEGATWATIAEEIDAITVNFISANIYVRGADTVMAYVYDDAGVQKYNEKILIAGAAFPYHAIKQKRRDMRTLMTL